MVLSRRRTSGTSILLIATICGRLRELRVVETQLTIERLVVAQRRAAVAGGGVEQVDQHARAFQVAQEAVAEARPAVRALDQPGDVGDDEASARRCRRTMPRFGTSVVNG